MERDFRDILIEQNAGLRKRIDVLEAENRRMREAVLFTVRTLDLCRDPQANTLAKMCDRHRAEEMLRGLLHGEQPCEGGG